MRSLFIPLQGFLRKHPISLLLIFFFFLYHSNLREQGPPSDAFALKLINISLIRGHGFDVGETMREMHKLSPMLDPWGSMNDSSPWYRMDRPPYAALPFMPIYAAVELLRLPVTLFTINFLGKFCAVFYGLVTLFLLYRIALNLGASERRALGAVFAFGAGTSLWHTLSQQFLSSTGFIPFFTAGLYFSTSAKLDRRRILLTGLAWGYALACRYQDAVLLVPLVYALLKRRPTDRLALLAPLLACALLVAATNLLQTDSILGTYASTSPSTQYQAAVSGGAIGLASNPLNGIAANLVSPGRGLFFYAPLLLFPFFWLRSGARKEKVKSGSPFTASILLMAFACQLVLVGSFSYWWGGWSWGPRLMATSLPLFFVLFVSSMPQSLGLAQKRLLLACLAWGVFAQSMGVYKYFMWTWNWRPVDVNENPMRVWDVRDNPVVRAWNEDFYPTHWNAFSIDM